jgi:predicted transcriptional regulator
MPERAKGTTQKLSRRERQVMDILYSREQATAAEIHDALPDPPTFSATRAVIRTLEEKGHIRHEEQGLRYIYLPVISIDRARKSAVAHLVSTFFNGSPTRLMAELLDRPSREISEDELASLEALIRKAKGKSK